MCVTAWIPAWAGGGTGGGGSSASTSDGSAGTGGGSAGTGGGTVAGDTTGPGGGDDVCGECTQPGPQSVEILSPADGEVVTSPVDVRVTSLYTCYCDTCGCFESYPESSSLEVDGETVDSCSSSTCNLDDFVFTVELSPGAHQLRVRTSYDFGGEWYSSMITVTVQGTASEGSSAADGTAGATEGGGADDPGSGGCACSAAGGSDPRMAGAWALGLWVVARRRRRR